MKKEWFESWFDSPFYPLLYDKRDEEEANLFVTNLMNFLKPPANSRMVDIACGEGRYAWQLAEYGNEVIGIDLSEQRIEKAKNLENEKLHFYVHDMRFPFYINYFDFAFNFFTSFGYFEASRNNHMAARSFAAALKPGGILVLDYFNEYYVKKHLVPFEEKTHNSVVFRIKRYTEPGKIVKGIYIKEEGGRESHFQERVSDFRLEDFVQLFGTYGLDLLHTFGDYRLNTFDKELSPRLITVFRKMRSF